MKQLIKLLRWRAQLRFLRKRVQSLEQQLDAERWRNLTREDYFVSAAVMGGRGMVGIPPRTGPVQQQAQPQPQTYNPFQLRGAELLEYEAYWKPDAEAAGISEQEAQRQFMMELAKRRGTRLQDDPFAN